MDTNKLHLYIVPIIKIIAIISYDSYVAYPKTFIESMVKGGFKSRINAVFEVGGESIQDIPSRVR